jgi:hypothetical protein
MTAVLRFEGDKAKRTGMETYIFPVSTLRHKRTMHTKLSTDRSSVSFVSLSPVSLCVCFCQSLPYVFFWYISSESPYTYDIL